MSPLNSYFLQGSPGEQRLIQDLVNEQLKMYGEDVLYLPRKIIGENTVIRENTAAKFDDSFRIEAYLMNYEGFQGASAELLTKFGVRNTDELTLVISKERYDDFVQPIIDQFPVGERKKAKRPNEGDLIFFPLEGALFEIKFVEGKKPFYQLRNLYVYELLCERFEFEDEIIDVSQVDSEGSNVNETVSQFGNILTLNLVGAGATTAVASVSGIVTDTTYSSLQYLDLIHDGSGYKTAPRVVIEKPGFGDGIRAEGTSTLGIGGSITGVTITSPGTQYMEVPSVTFETPTVPSEYSVDLPSQPGGEIYSIKLNDFKKFTFNISDLIGGNTLKSGQIEFNYYFDGTSTPTSGYLLQTETVRILWAGNRYIRVEIKRSDTGSWASTHSGNIYLNPSVFDSGWNEINFTWRSSSILARYEIYVGNSQIYALSLGSSWYNQDLISDGTYTLGNNYTTQYYGNIIVRDGIDDIIENFKLVSPQVAQGTAVVSAAGTISSILISSPGIGYTSRPAVTIQEPESGTTASAVAIMTSRTPNNDLSIDRLLITNPGYGYTVSPRIRFEGGGGSGGIATAIINTGVLPVVAISSGGVGYTTDPQVFIEPIFVAESVGVSSEINNAKAEVVRNANGQVSEIRYSNAGAGYTFTPSITFTLPTSDTFGEYEYNEIVTGQRSGATGYVREWDADDRILKLGTVNGVFQRGEAVVGAGASYKVSTVDTNEFLDEFADNIDIESEADAIVDFSQVNPFGEF